MERVRGRRGKRMIPPVEGSGWRLDWKVDRDVESREQETIDVRKDGIGTALTGMYI